MGCFGINLNVSNLIHTFLLKTNEKAKIEMAHDNSIRVLENGGFDKTM